jgi:hypothetical protein
MVMGGRFVHGSAYATTQDPTPASILQFFASTPALQAHPAVAADYLVSLDSNWLTHAQGVEPELKETLKLKSQSVVSGVLESFVSALSREQLTEVVGEPTDARVDAALPTLRGAARTSGRLDDYLSATQVEVLLARAAYHMLTQRKEAEAAIYLYLLAGRYSEVVEELCTQLAAVLIPAERGGAQSLHAQEVARTQWHTLSENFIERYIQGGDAQTQTVVLHTLTVTGGRGLVDALLLLTNMFHFVDAARSPEMSPVQALRLLDQLQVLPTALEQVGNFTAYSQYLQPVMDDLLVMAMECTTRAYQVAHAERARQASTTSGAGSFAGLLTDKDLQLQALRSRASALSAFAQRVKGRLTKQDTCGVLARMEAFADRSV